jgi:hypothetical protein
MFIETGCVQIRIQNVILEIMSGNLFLIIGDALHADCQEDKWVLEIMLETVGCISVYTLPYHSCCSLLHNCLFNLLCLS